MKNYEEITADLMRRREEYRRKKKQQKLLLTRAGVLLSCCALVAVLGFQTVPSGNVPLPNFGTLPNDGAGGNRVPNNVPTDSDPLNGTGSPGNQQGNVPTPDDDRPSIVDPDDDFAVGDWKGKAVTGLLLEKLPDMAAEDVLPLVWAKPGIDMEYIYRGKTLRQYWEASEQERTLPERLAELYKLGDSLKYGEALYTTGTPTGEKWEEELYREVVTHIGQELLDQYIIKGEFLKEKLWETLRDNDFLYVAQAEWSNALEVYREYACSKTKGVLLAQGLEAYHPGNYVGIANITKAQFEALDAEYFATWTFGLGEEPDAPQDMTDTDDTVAGLDPQPDGSTDNVDDGIKFTPDSRWPGTDTSAYDGKIGVGVDALAREDKPVQPE